MLQWVSPLGIKDEFPCCCTGAGRQSAVVSPLLEVPQPKRAALTRVMAPSWGGPYLMTDWSSGVKTWPFHLNSGQLWKVSPSSELPRHPLRLHCSCLYQVLLPPLPFYRCRSPEPSLTELPHAYLLSAGGATYNPKLSIKSLYFFLEVDVSDWSEEPVTEQRDDSDLQVMRTTRFLLTLAQKLSTGGNSDYNPVLLGHTAFSVQFDYAKIDQLFWFYAGTIWMS